MKGQIGSFHTKIKRIDLVSPFAGFLRMTGWNAMIRSKTETFMKIRSTLHFLLLIAALGLPMGAHAQGTAFHYQGRLVENDVPVSGVYDFIFTVHDAEVDGNALGVPLPLSGITVEAGLFLAPLDFGADVFTGAARWLEISVRADGDGTHTLLAPRQALLPTPYAIHAENATHAGTATHAGSASAVENGGVTVDQFSTGLAPAPGQFLSYADGNLVWSDPGVAAGNIWSKNGTSTFYNAGNVGIGTTSPETKLAVFSGGYGIEQTDGTRRLSTYLSATGGWLGTRTAHPLHFFVDSGQSSMTVAADGSVGIGTTTPTPGVKLEVAGTTLLRPANGTVQFGAPNGELGLSIIPNIGNRADLRFDGSVLKLVASTGVVPPSTANGLAITTGGNVGIGTTAPVAKLHAETPLANTAAVYGKATGAGGVGVYGQSAQGAAVYAEGNAVQARDKGGFVKAMAFIDPFLPADQYVVRGYNSNLSGDAATTAPCGITVTRTKPGNYFIDFGFKVDDRFISVTPRYSGVTVASGPVPAAGPNHVFVSLQSTENVDELIDISFYILVF